MLNGKIDGIANLTELGMRAQKLYFDLFLGEDRSYSKYRGWISGTGTSRAFIGDVSRIKLSEPTEPVPAGDYIAYPDAQMYYFAVDRSGSLTWERGKL